MSEGTTYDDDGISSMRMRFDDLNDESMNKKSTRFLNKIHFLDMDGKSFGLGTYYSFKVAKRTGEKGCKFNFLGWGKKKKENKLKVAR